jgi:CubicO group peptidase (beta-lactamase class C family)
MPKHQYHIGIGPDRHYQASRSPIDPFLNNETTGGLSMPLSSLLDAIQFALPDWLAAAHTPGAAIAILERGQAPLNLCAGIQDLESQRPVTPETVFEAASLGKPVFACLVLQLAGEGRLNLDAPLSAYLPDAWVPAEPRLPQITARRVLSHSSGLPNWFREGAPRALVFAPGERFGYSGEGYLYLQRVVEQITGQPLEALVWQRLFEPLGMRRSLFVCPEAFGEETAQGHDPEGHPLPKWKPWANAGTSLHTTLADYACFLQQMLSGGHDLLPGGASSMLPWQSPIDAETAWGLGWGLKRISGDLLFWQWGDNDGWKHFAGGSLAQGRGVLVLTNGERGSQVWNEVLHRTLDPNDDIYTWLSAL